MSALGEERGPENGADCLRRVAAEISGQVWLWQGGFLIYINRLNGNRSSFIKQPRTSGHALGSRNYLVVGVDADAAAVQTMRLSATVVDQEEDGVGVRRQVRHRQRNARAAVGLRGEAVGLSRPVVL